MPGLDRDGAEMTAPFRRGELASAGGGQERVTVAGISGKPALGGFTSARAAMLVAATALLAVVALLSLAVGSKQIPIVTVVRAFIGFDGSSDHLIVRELRLPRTLVGVLVGAALGVSGALMQAITRNPLADPGLLGVSGGAAFAVVFAIVVLGATSLASFVWFAFVGAGAASFVVYALGSLGRGGATPVRLALAGAATSSLLASITSAVILVDKAALDQFRFWAVGSLSGRDYTVVFRVSPFLAVGLIIALAVARPLNTVALGEDAALALGANVGLTKFVTAVAVTLLAGAATAACGPIGFIGLTVPHVARLLCGPDQRWVLPYSAVIGPIVLLGCDVVGRVIAGPSEVQVGIMTAGIGGPVFVALVRRVRMSSL